MFELPFDGVSIALGSAGAEIIAALGAEWPLQEAESIAMSRVYGHTLRPSFAGFVVSIVPQTTVARTPSLVAPPPEKEDECKAENGAEVSSS
jgi:hypothetical protein